MYELLQTILKNEFRVVVLVKLKLKNICLVDIQPKQHVGGQLKTYNVMSRVSRHFNVDTFVQSVAMCRFLFRKA